MGRAIKTKIKSFASLLLAIVMLVSLMPTVLANPAEKFSDFPTGWSKPAMEAAVNNGLLVGVGDGKIGPQQYLTRAEMAAVMVRAFGATTYTDISGYTDVEIGKWYYAPIASAVKMGALSGVSASEMAPEQYITREQVFTVLARLLALSGDNYEVVGKFSDGWDVSSWALTSVIALVERGYVSGDSNGALNPKAPITREEFAQLMYSTIKQYITAPGVYENMTMDGIVVIRVGNVTLRNVTVTGDLVIGDGAAKNDIILENVTINGRLLTRGGTNTLKNCVISNGVVVLNPNGITMFKNYGTEIEFVGMVQHTMAGFLTSGGISFGGGSSGSSSSSKKEYTVTFKLFEDDTEAYAKITVKKNDKIGSKMPDDPDPEEIEGYEFKGWRDTSGKTVTSQTRITKNLTVYADLDPIETDAISVTFYKGYGEDAVLIKKVDLAEDATKIAKADIPKITNKTVVFEKNKYMPEDYEDYTGTYEVKPVFWYLDDAWKNFDENVEITEDMDVYLLYQSVALLGLGSSVSTRYDSNLRLMDSAKALSHSLVGQLELASSTNLAAYEKITGKVLDTLQGRDIIDEDKNIKMMSFPIDIGVVVGSKDTAKGMVKKYIRTTVSDEDALDDLLRIINVQDLIKGLDIQVLIDSLTAEQITSIITDSANESLVTGFLYDDLQLEESTMLSFVVNYLKTNESFKTTIIQQLMEELADASKDANSGLKASAIAHLKTELAKSGDFQSKFAEMLVTSLTGDSANATLKANVITAIKSGNLKDTFAQAVYNALKSDGTNAMKTFALNKLKNDPTIRAQVIDSVMTKLADGSADDEWIEKIKANGVLQNWILTSIQGGSVPMLEKVRSYAIDNIADRTNGTALRKAILTSDGFINILKTSAVKTEVINLLIDTTFIETILADATARQTIIDEIDEETMLDLLWKNEAFKNKVVAGFHTGGAFVEDIEHILNNENYEKAIFTDVLVDEHFVAAVNDPGKNIETTLSESMVLEDFVDTDDLLKHIFGQENVVGDYDYFITDNVKGQVEEIISEEYNALSSYNTLDDAKKQLVKDIIFANNSMRAAIKAEIEANYATGDELADLGYDIDDVVKYVLDQPYTGDYSDIDDEITPDDIDNIISTTLENNFVKYDGLPDIEKQDIKNKIYNYIVDCASDDDDTNDGIKNTVNNKIDEAFNTFVGEVMADIKAGIGLVNYEDNTFVMDAVHKILNDYLDQYIAGTLTDDDVSGVIEAILISTVKDVLTKKDETDGIYPDLKSHIDSLKASILNNYDENKGIINAVVKELAKAEEGETSQLETIVTGKYDTLATQVASMLKAQNSIVYGKVENVLVSKIRNIDPSLINDTLISYSNTTEGQKFITDSISSYATIANIKIEAKAYLSTATPTQIQEIENIVSSYISTDLDDADIQAYATKDMILTLIGGMSDTEVGNLLDQFLAIPGNSAQVTTIAIDVVKNMANAEISTYLAEFLKTDANKTTVENEIKKFINDPAQEATIISEASKYVKDSNNKTTVENYIKSYIKTDVNLAFVQANFDFIKGALTKIDKDTLASIVGSDGKVIKDYIATLGTEAERNAFADKIYNAIAAMEEFEDLIDDMFDKDGKLFVTSQNVTLFKALETVIRALSIDSALEFAGVDYIEKIIELVGEDLFLEIFNEAKNGYCDGLLDAIAEVEGGASSVKYTSALTVKFNPVYILSELYENALPKVEAKLRGMNVSYDDNEYLIYLVDHDVLDRLVTGDGVETEELTGYTLKSASDYARYMVELLVAVDDALCWYGDELSGEELEAVYEAVFAKLYSAHDRLVEIMDDFSTEGTLPYQLESIIDAVDQLNSLYIKLEPQVKNFIDRYLASDAYDQVTGGGVEDNTKVQTTIDILFGTEDPVFTIDCLYDIFYKYDDKMQAKLKSIISTGKLDAAIERFKDSRAGDMISEDIIEEIVAIIETVADKGIEEYKVDTSSNKTTIDKYVIELGGNEFTLIRSLEF